MVCPKCGEDKPESEFYYTPFGPYPICKECCGRVRTQIGSVFSYFLKREYNDEGELLKKECRRCGELFDICHFHATSSSIDGYSHICHECSAWNDFGLPMYIYKDGGITHKRCPRCFRMLPVTPKYFGKKCTNKLGKCRDCQIYLYGHGSTQSRVNEVGDAANAQRYKILKEKKEKGDLENL